MRREALKLYILFHLREVGMDYAKSISKVTKVPIEEVVLVLEELEQEGLIERTSGSAVKRTDAKLKLSHEVRKHHTYYTLTNKGKERWKRLRRELAKELDEAVGDKTFELLEFLREAKHEHLIMIAKKLSMTKERAQELLERCEEEGLVVEVKPKTLKAKHRRAKPKKETRCLHKYYKLTRLGELLLRYSKRS